MDLPKKINKRDDILEKYNPDNCLLIYRKINSALQASKEDCPSLATLKKEYDEKLSLTMIRIWLVSLNNFVNSARKLSSEQIDEISLYIFDDYYYLNMADLYLITTRIKKGHYGNLYENLDGMKVLSFFKDYASERADGNEAETIHEHDRIKYLEEKERPFNAANYKLK